MAIKQTICLIVMLSCCSCTINGRLYTDKVVPFSENFHNTEVGTKSFIIDDFKVKEPISGYNISVEWMNSTLKEKATKAGIKNIHYADLRIFSVLLGVYSKNSLIVYGD